MILAREIDLKPDLLIAVHPIRGLDIGAAQYIHDRLMEARAYGCAILLISTDLEEILQMADRMTVIFEGKMMGEFSGISPDLEKISMAMAGRA